MSRATPVMSDPQLSSSSSFELFVVSNCTERCAFTALALTLGLQIFS